MWRINILCFLDFQIFVYSLVWRYHHNVIKKWEFFEIEKKLSAMQLRFEFIHENNKG